MKSKSCHYFIILISVLLQSAESMAQTPLWQWSGKIGNTSGDIGYSIAAGASGNVYTTGYFSGTADFDPGPGVFFLSSGGSEDIFISKLDPSGNFIWAVKMGGSLNDVGLSITLDDSENVYTTGYFQDTADFDPGNGIFNLISGINEGIFISKLDSSGSLVFAKAVTGAFSSNSATCIKQDESGNLVVTGFFTGTADFDPDTSVYNLTSASSYGIFILKLDQNGQFIWAESLDGNGDSGGYSIDFDPSGNIYLTGVFQGTVDFDPGPAVYYLVANGWLDFYILKLDTMGNFIWAKSIGGYASDAAYSLAYDPAGSGSIYITGLFEDSVDFDPGNGVHVLASPGNQDGFISKYDTAGNFIWVKALSGNNGSAICASLLLDKTGNIHVLGNFSGTIDFDPDTTNFPMAATGLSDVFYLKLTNSGNYIWAKKSGWMDYDYGQCITLDTNDNIFITGSFESNFIAFDADTLLNSDLPGVSSDIYIAAMNCTNTSAITATVCVAYTSPSGNYTWTQSGIYYDLLTNSNGCDSIIKINLTVIPVEINVNAVDALLFAMATNATYQWLDCDNGYTVIPGATGQLFQAMNNGNYAVAVTQNGCTDTSACYNVTGIGINEIENESGFELFPNPATNQVTISSERNISHAEISINDITGKLILMTSFISGKSIELNTNDFSPGIYLVQIQTPEFIATKKLVITK